MEKTSEIYLAGGCFWGTEHFLKQIRGVKHTEVGLWGIERSGFFNGREKWVEGFENQMV